MTDQPTVALLGTGTMGAGMARNIAAAGIPLRVWNRSADKAAPLKDAGAQVAGSPAEAVAGADIVVTMLFDTASVAATIEEADPASGTIWIQSSTVGVEGTDELRAMALQRGLKYVDAPVLGTKQPAEQGNLVVLAAGPPEVHEFVTPVFDAIGSRTMWVGGAGQATRLKLVANGWVLTVLDGVAQSLRMAEALGLDPQLFVDAIEGGAMYAPYIGLKAGAMMNGQFDPAFTLSGAVKDAGLIEDAARAAGADAAFVAIARKHLQAAADAGHGDKDMAAIYLAVSPVDGPAAVPPIEEPSGPMTFSTG